MKLKIVYKIRNLICEKISMKEKEIEQGFDLWKNLKNIFSVNESVRSKCMSILQLGL